MSKVLLKLILPSDAIAYLVQPEKDNPKLIGEITLHGIICQLKQSYKSAVINGKHLIFTPKENLTLSDKDKSLMLYLAYYLAKWAASQFGEEERFRLAVNGPKLAHNSGSFHIHIILPKGDDILPRLVDNIQSPLSN